ncbi:hypothetical protein K466DRAFT_535178 [Polyporus arcularius HHB13444]|uniref:Uncharacterized protein n=1 Tax=Polyporus arcularius HHB13444 TaxID=1314778 RepID=A0A5C3PY37_9APHY|nr:hypothetical protein K466DRAFT_535178 [Polyporus arcularius HHB13444]
MIRLTELPDDILEDIFHGMRDIMRFPGEPPYAPLQQEEDTSRSSADTEHKTVPLCANVIVLSHVCRHWRNLMLTRPHLWTFIRVTGSFPNRIMVNEMIERSGDFPLSILLTDSEQSNDALYDLLGVISVISDHSERIRELGIILRRHARLVLDSLSECRLPRLEKLWIETQLEPEDCYAASPAISIFDTVITPLRVIHVSQMVFNRLPFHDLTQLELICGVSPPLYELLDTIRHSPLLQTLTLSIVLSKDEDGDEDEDEDDADDEDEDDTVPHNEPTAVLSCLSRLQLQVDPVFSDAFSVLPHIAFPSSTAVYFSFSGRRFASSLSTGCESLEALARSVEHVSFALDDNHAYLVSRSPQLSIDYEVADVEFDEPGQAQGEFAARLCEGFLAVPLPVLTSLSIRIFADPDSGLVLNHERFVRLFEAVPSIQRLAVDVHPDDSAYVFTALATIAKDERENEVVICPELKEFVVTWQAEPSADDFWNLERCCHSRASGGCGVARLETVAFPLLIRATLEQSVPCIVEVGYRK